MSLSLSLYCLPWQSSTPAAPVDKGVFTCRSKHWRKKKGQPDKIRSCKNHDGRKILCPRTKMSSAWSVDAWQGKTKWFLWQVDWKSLFVSLRISQPRFICHLVIGRQHETWWKYEAWFDWISPRACVSTWAVDFESDMKWKTNLVTSEVICGKLLRHAVGRNMIDNIKFQRGQIQHGWSSELLSTLYSLYLCARSLRSACSISPRS